MKQIWVAIFIIVLICPGSVSSKIYRYVDKEGHVCFTNDYSSIPADTNSKILQYNEIEHDASIPPAKLPTYDSPPFPASDRSYQKQALQNKRTLVEEYNDLLKEKQALDSDKSFQKRRIKRKYQNRPFIQKLINRETWIIKRLAELEEELKTYD